MARRGRLRLKPECKAEVVIEVEVAVVVVVVAEVVVEGVVEGGRRCFPATYPPERFSQLIDNQALDN